MDEDIENKSYFDKEGSVVKKTFISIVLVIVLVSCLNTALATSIAKLGLIPSSNLVVYNENGSSEIENDFSVSAAYDYFWPISGSSVEVGFGFETPQNINIDPVELKFMPIYGLVNFPFTNEKLKPYLSCKVGVSLFNGPSNWFIANATDYKSGLFYSMGGGFIYNNNFRIEALYSVYNGQNTLTEYFSGYYISEGVSYKLSNITLFLGYTF